VFIENGTAEKFYFENSITGIEFHENSPLTVKLVKPRSPGEELGVRSGMVLASISGRDITNSTVKDALDMLNEAVSELPPLEVPEEIRQRAETFMSQMSAAPVRKPSERFTLTEPVYLTGPWAKWGTSFADGLLEPVPSKSTSTALLILCVRMTSQSFTFQVITPERKWDWHLYPRDAKPIKIGFISSHVSKEGLLKAASPDNAIVGLGDQKLGHGINFHVVQKPGTIVTVWVEVPTKTSGDGNSMILRTDTASGARIWYTLEDTGVQCVAGDGINLERYRKYLPADIKFD
jgi:hypothetical protein